MPARRFWMMDRQIDRIRAENDLRQIQLTSLHLLPQNNQQLQQIQDHIGRLTLEIGEKVTVRRNVLVTPEPSAKAKFAKIIGG